MIFHIISVLFTVFLIKQTLLSFFLKKKTSFDILSENKWLHFQTSDNIEAEYLR